KDIGKKDVNVLVATGGIVENLGVLGLEYFGEKESSKISLETLHQIEEQMQNLSVDERMKRYDLKSDRADVIMPALIILTEVAKQAKAKEVLIPSVGLKEGLLLDIISEGVELKQ